MNNKTHLQLVLKINVKQLKIMVTLIKKLYQYLYQLERVSVSVLYGFKSSKILFMHIGLLLITKSHCMNMNAVLVRVLHA